MTTIARFYPMIVGPIAQATGLVDSTQTPTPTRVSVANAGPAPVSFLVTGDFNARADFEGNGQVLLAGQSAELDFNLYFSAVAGPTDQINALSTIGICSGT